MTYEQVIDWCFENYDVANFTTFQEWFDTCNADFLDNNRNSLYDILPTSYIDGMAKEFNDMKAEPYEYSPQVLEYYYPQTLTELIYYDLRSFIFG